jgi:hypothetical protein
MPPGQTRGRHSRLRQTGSSRSIDPDNSACRSSRSRKRSYESLDRSSAGAARGPVAHSDEYSLSAPRRHTPMNTRTFRQPGGRLCWLDHHGQPRAHAPREAEFKDWYNPVDAINVRPSHFTEAEDCAALVHSVRTYPVYHPDSGPPGYLDSLRKRGAEPVLELAHGMYARRLDRGAARRVWEELDAAGPHVGFSARGLCPSP